MLDCQSYFSRQAARNGTDDRERIHEILHREEGRRSKGRSVWNRAERKERREEKFAEGTK